MESALDLLIAAAHRLLSNAVRAGADEAEVFGISGRSVDVELRCDSIESASESFICGLGLRAVVRGAVGFASTSDLERLELVADSAVRAARARVSDEEWKSLPEPAACASASKIFDPRISGISPEECLEMAGELLIGCSDVPGAEPLSGGVGCFSGTEIVINTRGLELYERGTSEQVSLDSIAKGCTGEVATGSEFDISRMLSADLRGIGMRAARMAVSSLGGTAFETRTCDVILAPLAFADLLDNTLIPSFSAENVQKGRSRFAGRVGTEVFDRRLQLIDDGLLPAGLGTSGFDGEGVPSRENVLVEKGVLMGYLYDTYTAGKDGVRSTGSAVRTGYSDLPRIGVRNLIISSSMPVDPFEDVEYGLSVSGLIGAHTANPISGDFSVEARNSFIVRDGRTDEPVKSAMIAGNIFEILGSIEVGSDVRAVGGIVTPSVRVRMKVVG